jgi:hypothetical protein
MSDAGRGRGGRVRKILIGCGLLGVVVFGLAVLGVIEPHPPQTATTETPCSGGDQIAFAHDADAGASYGRGWVRMWNCPNGDVFIKHGGTTRSPIIKLDERNSAEYAAGLTRARARGRVVKITD